MKQKIIYVLKRLRNVVEITLVVFLLYTFIITLIGVEYPAEGFNGGRSTSLDLFYFSSYMFIEATSYSVKYHEAFFGQKILEIMLLLLPLVIWICYELYIRRDKLIKNYDSYKQKKNNKKIKRLEQKLSQLKSKEQ